MDDYNYEMNEPVRKGHGGIALLLSIFGLMIILFVGIVFGMFGIVPGTIMAVLGIVLGIMSIRATQGRSGKGGLIIGIVAIIFSIMMSGIVFALRSFLKSEDVERYIPTLSSYADDSYSGVIGLFMKMNSDHVDMDELQKEIDVYNEKMGNAVQTSITEKN